jgi:DNA-binding response OmpR family regulator
MHVAIVEDDPIQGRLMGQLLEDEGAATDIFRNGRQFLSHASRTAFDLAVIDLRLPDIHGLQLLEKLSAMIRLGGRPLPAIVVTGCAEPSAMAEAFARGAADFLLKPLRAHEFTLRARSAMQRWQPELFDEGPIQAGGLLLNRATLQAYVGERELPLTAKEFHLAWLLARQVGRTVARSQLLRLVWGRSHASESRSLDTHIGRLRRKLDLHQDHRVRLRPVYGVGYRMDVFP